MLFSVQKAADWRRNPKLVSRAKNVNKCRSPWQQKKKKKKSSWTTKPCAGFSGEKPLRKEAVSEKKALTVRKRKGSK